MADSGGDAPKIDLQHPEIFSEQQLISLIKEKGVKRDDLDKVGKSCLLELYHKTVLPLPQRKYRLNRRGQQMTKLQVLMSKRKRTHEEANQPSTSSSPPARKDDSSSSKFLCSFSPPGSSSGDRLKPPPSAINTERKVIRLGSKPSSETNKTSSDSQTKPGVIRLKPSTGSGLDFEIKSRPATSDSGSSKSTNGAMNKGSAELKTESVTSTDSTVVTVKSSEKGVTVTKVTPTTKLDPVKRQPIKLNRSNVPTDIRDSEPEPESVSEKDSKEESSAMDTAEGSKEDKQTAVETPSPTSDEGVVQKKFRSISITYP